MLPTQSPQSVGNGGSTSRPLSFVSRSTSSHALNRLSAAFGGSDGVSDRLLPSSPPTSAYSTAYNSGSSSLLPTSWRRPRLFFYVLLTIVTTFALLAITGKPISSSSSLISLPWFRNSRGKLTPPKKKERKHWRGYDECRNGKRVRKDAMIEDLWIELDDVFESDAPPPIKPSPSLALYPGLLASPKSGTPIDKDGDSRKLQDTIRRKHNLVKNWGGRKIILQPELLKDGWQGDNTAESKVEWHNAPLMGRPRIPSKKSSGHTSTSQDAVDLAKLLEKEREGYGSRVEKRSRPLPLLWDHRRDFGPGPMVPTAFESTSSKLSSGEAKIHDGDPSQVRMVVGENEMEAYDYIPRHVIQVWNREIRVPNRIRPFKPESDSTSTVKSPHSPDSVETEYESKFPPENKKAEKLDLQNRALLRRADTEKPEKPQLQPQTQSPPQEYLRGKKVQPAVHTPQIEALMFGIVTTVERALVMSQLWNGWMVLPSTPPSRNESRILREYGHPDKDNLDLATDTAKQPSCLILLASSESEESIEELKWTLKKRKIMCGIKVSTVERYEVRVLSMGKEMKEYARDIGKEFEWYIFNDDDTFWLDIRAVQRMLARYDPEEKWFVGATTEAMNQLNTFGRMAFGGAGMLVSDPLISRMEELWDECFDRFRWLFGGDEMVTRCAALAKGATKQTVTTEEKGLHQFDIPGDTTGIFQSGMPFINLHHYLGGSWVHLFGYGSYRDDFSQILLIQRVVEFLGGDNVFKRYMFGDGKWLYTSGYSITLFEEPLKEEDMKYAEHTWYEGYRLSVDDREQFHERHGPDGSKAKVTFYIDDIEVLSPGTAILTFVEADAWYEQISSADRIRIQVLWDGCWDVTKSGEQGCLAPIPPEKLEL